MTRESIKEISKKISKLVHQRKGMKTSKVKNWETFKKPDPALMLEFMMYFPGKRNILYSFIKK